MSKNPVVCIILEKITKHLQSQSPDIFNDLRCDLDFLKSFLERADMDIPNFKCLEDALNAQSVFSLSGDLEDCAPFIEKYNVSHQEVISHAARWLLKQQEGK